MANEKFKIKKGKKANLPAKEAGSLIIATDTQEMFVDVSSTQRIQIGGNSSTELTFGKIPVYTTATAIDDANKILQPVSNALTSVEPGVCFFVNYQEECNPEAGDTTLIFEDLGERYLVSSNSVKYHMPGSYALYQMNDNNEFDLIFSSFQSCNFMTSDSNFAAGGAFKQPIILSNETNYVQHKLSNISSRITSSSPTLLANGNSQSYTSGVQLNHGDEISISDLQIDTWGHIYNETDWKAKLPLPKRGAFTTQTDAEFRNIVVVPSSTNLSTLDVPIGTIIFVKN